MAKAFGWSCPYHAQKEFYFGWEGSRRFPWGLGFYNIPVGGRVVVGLAPVVGPDQAGRVITGVLTVRQLYDIILWGGGGVRYYFVRPKT